MAQEKNHDAANVLLQRYKNLVRSKAHGFFLAGGDAEDLMQEGMLGLYDAILAYDAQKKSSFRTFASACIVHKIMDAVRLDCGKKNAPLNNYISFADDGYAGLSFSSGPEETVILEESTRELLAKISSVLSDFEYRIIRMYMDGMNLAQIAESIQKPTKSVDNALQRAKKKLKTLFDKE